MTRRQLSQAEVEQIVEMRERGKSVSVIARVIGCSKGAVDYHCLKLGVEPLGRTRFSMRRHQPDLVVTRDGHQVCYFTPEEDAWLLRLEAAGKSPSAIGRDLGRRPQSIIARLRTLARQDARRELSAASMGARR